MYETWFSIKLRAHCSFYYICYCAIFIAFYSSVISCGKTFQERMSLIMYIKKECVTNVDFKMRLRNFISFLWSSKIKKASVNNSLKVEYKQDMPFVTFNFIPTFWSSDKGSCFVGMGKRIANCRLNLQKCYWYQNPSGSLEVIDNCNNHIKRRLLLHCFD